MHKAVVVLIMFLGILFVAVEITRIKAGMQKRQDRVIYRYIPRTFEEEQLDPIPVSDVFETMFSQPSPWVGSIRTYDRRKQEKVNQYFINQL
jgi:hypothetical protein